MIVSHRASRSSAPIISAPRLAPPAAAVLSLAAVGMRASIEAMMLLYMRAWQQPTYPMNDMNRDQLINQIFLMRIMRLPAGTPAALVAFADAYQQRLQTFVGQKYSAHLSKSVPCARKVNFAPLLPSHSPSSTSTPFTYPAVAESLRWALEHFQTNPTARWGYGELKYNSMKRALNVHLSIHHLTSTIVDEWLVARAEGNEQQFIGSLHFFSFMFNMLNHNASRRRAASGFDSKVDFLLRAAHRNITTALMYLATHIVFVQTDYSTMTPRQIIALKEICDFLASTLIVAEDTSDTELVAECIAVFYESPKHRHRCEPLWHSHVDVDSRQPPVPSTQHDPTHEEAVKINHFIMTLQHVCLCMLRRSEV
jgi:hypothetical protein